MTAFSPASLRAGAVVSYDRDRLVVSGAGIVDAVPARLMGDVLERRDQWLMPGVPVLSRGEAWIVPLFWMPDESTLDEADRWRLEARGSELGQSIANACRYAYGEPLGVDLGPQPAPTKYAAELVRTGVADAAWWAVGDSAIVLAYHRAPGDSAERRMAVHVVPVDWVSARRPAKAGKPRRLDLGWRWADLVEFAAAV